MNNACLPTPAVASMTARLAGLPGVRAVVLGGSRARGTNRPDSDRDLGVYHRGAPDLGALSAPASEVQGTPVEVAGPGGRGPWVNGGAWLTVDGVAVDWILRDPDRVRPVWPDCREGRFEVGIQPGHPLGFRSPCYVGEVALGRVLQDAHSQLTYLQEAVGGHPEPLRRALTEAAWEADFLVVSARVSRHPPRRPVPVRGLRRPRARPSRPPPPVVSQREGRARLGRRPAGHSRGLRRRRLGGPARPGRHRGGDGRPAS